MEADTHPLSTCAVYNNNKENPQYKQQAQVPIWRPSINGGCENSWKLPGGGAPDKRSYVYTSRGTAPCRTQPDDDRQRSFQPTASFQPTVTLTNSRFNGNFLQRILQPTVINGPHSDQRSFNDQSESLWQVYMIRQQQHLCAPTIIRT